MAKVAVGARTPIPVTVIGGYLGAGKTTLLNHVLRGTHGVRFAVLVNDFGALAIDEQLIRAHDGDTVTLTNGCICCSLASGFADTLFGLRDRVDPPQAVLVEASGVSDPQAIAQYAHIDGFCLDGVVVVADADTIRERSTDRYVGRQVLEQLRGADVVLLNKTDLLTADQVGEVRSWLHHQVPGAGVIETVGARAPLEALLSMPDAERGTNHRAGHHAEPHADHLTRAFESSGYLTSSQLTAFTEALPSGVVRAKGAVALDHRPDTRFELQVVGRRITVIDTGRQWGDEEPTSRIVLIGLPDTDQADIDRALATLEAP